jgi:hypothetical protein
MSFSNAAMTSCNFQGGSVQRERVAGDFKPQRRLRSLLAGAVLIDGLLGLTGMGPRSLGRYRALQQRQ